MILDRLTTRCRVPRSIAEVTSEPAGIEAAPEDVGTVPGGLRAIWSAVEGLYRTGLHPAIALCIRRRGRIVLNRAIGHAAGNGSDDPPGAPKVLVDPDTPFTIFSASKAVTAMVIHLLDQQHRLHIDDPVAEYLPGYERNGKHAITIRHVLSHRAGVPNLPPEAIDLDRMDDEEWMTNLLCEAEPLWRPGRFLGYHAISGGFILAAVVKQATGKDIRTVLGEEILEPLGFRWGNYGVAPEDVEKVAVNCFTGPPILPPLSSLLYHALGARFHEVIELSNDTRFLTGVVPAGNVVTTAEELSRFYQLLLDEGELGGTRIFEPRTIHRAALEESYLELDFTLGLPLRYSMGFMLGGEWFSLFGPATEHAFGHVGFTNVIGWADPERRLTVGLMTNGKPIIDPGLYHLFDLLRQISAAFPKDRIGPPIGYPSASRFRGAA